MPTNNPQSSNHQTGSPIAIAVVGAGQIGKLLKTYGSAADQSWHKVLQTRVECLLTVDSMAAKIDHF